jgi:UDP-N-acetylmuramoyl-L-alanyl-D-glutamate--2,6-diaminopimelate ligase
VQGRNLRIGADGVAFDVSTPWGSASLKSRLIGRFNAENLLGSLAGLLASDVGLEDSVKALQRVKALPGRTERYGGGKRPLVVVDYAHTPDALENVLLALREMISHHGSRLTPHEPRLICVFGCGGERDRGKRRQMGAIAARLADRVIITSDNPRGEDPNAIIVDIAKGVRGKRAAIEADRERAIRLGVGSARRGDIVLAAGKGHERYQEVDGIKHAFSDSAVATAALQESRS